VIVSVSGTALWTSSSFLQDITATVHKATAKALVSMIVFTLVSILFYFKLILIFTVLREL
jgi:hypothetical protein